ncbi:MAG: hypothetical protein V1915_05055 [Candidatus Bathyarchaeota archaeon]
MVILVIALFSGSTFTGQPVKAKSPVREMHLTFNVDPEGWIVAEGSLRDPSSNTASSPVNFTVLGSLITEKNRLSANFTVLIPEENATTFPFNSTVMSFLVKNAGKVLNLGFNSTLTLPSKQVLSQYLSPGDSGLEVFEYLLNSTDYTLDAEYMNGDVNLKIELVMVANMSDILALTNMSVGFGAPVIVNLDLSGGVYNGTVKFILLPGLPIEDVTIDVKGDPTGLCLNGSIRVIYGTYPSIGTLNRSVVDHLSTALTRLNGSVDVEGSMLNITNGMIGCPIIDIERENITGGEIVKFRVCPNETVPGGVLEFLASLVGPYPSPPSNFSNWYPLLFPFAMNDTLHNVQDGNIQIIYTPADTRLYMTVEGKMAVRTFLETFLEPKTVPAGWPESASGAPSTLNATTLPFEWELLRLWNTSSYALQNSRLHINYLHTNRQAELKFTASTNVEGDSKTLFDTLVELPLSSISPEFQQLIANLTASREFQQLLADPTVNITDRHLSLVYGQGEAHMNMVLGLEGDINLVSHSVLRVVNATFPELASKLLSYINQTRLDVTGLKCSFSVDDSATEVSVQGLKIQLPRDQLNATAFKLDRFFNLTFGDPSPEQGEQVKVTVTGSNNATHRLVLYRPIGVPEPNNVRQNNKGELASMTWNNVSLSDLRELQFIIMVGIGDQTNHQTIEHGGEKYQVSTFSNSTISKIRFNQPLMTMSFNVTGAEGTTGYCNVTLPKELLGGNFAVLVNDIPVTYAMVQNSSHYFIYFEYTHSTEEVKIIGTIVIPELQTLLAATLAMVGVTLILARKKLIRLRQKP